MCPARQEGHWGTARHPVRPPRPRPATRSGPEAMGIPGAALPARPWGGFEGGLRPAGTRHNPRSAPTPPPAHPELPTRGSGATYLPGGEQLQLAQPLQHALHVVLQGPHGAGHVGVQLRRQLLLHGGGLSRAPRILLCPGELRICGSKGRRRSDARRGGRVAQGRRSAGSSGALCPSTAGWRISTSRPQTGPAASRRARLPADRQVPARARPLLGPPRPLLSASLQVNSQGQAAPEVCRNIGGELSVLRAAEGGRAPMSGRTGTATGAVPHCVPAGDCRDGCGSSIPCASTSRDTAAGPTESCRPHPAQPYPRAPSRRCWRGCTVLELKDVRHSAQP